VENYIIWYVVIDDENDKKIMEVRRFAFMGQDQNKMI
jgi:hypothetical protein